MKITDLYESKFLTDESEIYKWMYESFIEFDPTKLTIEPDGLVYDGHLSLYGNKDKLKVQFKAVMGHFVCNFSEITSLEGSPKIVGASFICNDTNITSLKFCPTSIKLDFHFQGINKIADPKEYRYVLYSEIGNKFHSSYDEINEIINKYSGSNNRKYWPYAINLLSRVKL